MPDGSFVEPMKINPKAAMPPDIHLIFPARELAVRRALQTICKGLKTLSVDPATLGCVEIILAEVTNNIVEHAYPQDSTGTISLSCTKGLEIIRFEVVDHGKMLPCGEIPSKQNHDLGLGLQSLPEGGFGWGLIRDMTKRLVYRRFEGRNILRFAIAIEAH